MSGFRSNAELKSSARKQLSGKWDLAVIIIAIYIFFQIAVSMIPIAGSVIQFLVSGAWTFGLLYCYLGISRGEAVKVEDLFCGFKLLLKTLLVTILQTIIISLGFILLVVPGIIASLSLAMSYYILIDNPELSSFDVIKLSYNMMKGNRIRFLMLNLSFIGWAILATIPFGLGWLALAPYINVTVASFYNELRVIDSSENLGPDDSQHNLVIH